MANDRKTPNPRPWRNSAIARAALALLGAVCAGAGIVGVFVPVLPTTPFLLLAAFLFARSSSRLATWLESTRAYQSYVVPFKEKRGIKLRVKVRILTISYAVMSVSAFAVRNASVNVLVWALLAAVALWLLYLMAWRIPTLDPPLSQSAEAEEE